MKIPTLIYIFLSTTYPTIRIFHCFSTLNHIFFIIIIIIIFTNMTSFYLSKMITFENIIHNDVVSFFFFLI